MGNVWGTANPLALSPTIFLGGDIVCNAGVETTVLTSGTLVAPYPGNYYPMLWGVLAVLIGATPPTTLTYHYQVNGGANVNGSVAPPAALLANATIMVPFALSAPSTSGLWAGAGGIITVSLIAAAQAVTAKAQGSYMVIALFRGPDG